MPQLNPSPWLLTMILSWLVMSTMLSLFNKTSLPMNPTNKTKAHKMNTWTWPW
uniref:ATP synthase complex subunit 8 n=1 Tax=Brookesia superciliaris TaxID=179895 RepID=B7S654_BROSU|nr:ATP synthase F0 subunit 8 [Brookesia superciliaris]